MTNDQIEEELSEAQCRISDKINKLLDDYLPRRTLTPREKAFALRISEHLLMAEGLIEVLGKSIANEK